MMKKIYSSPDMEIVSFKLTDVILGSVNDENSIPEDVVEPGDDITLDF